MGAARERLRHHAGQQPASCVAVLPPGVAVTYVKIDGVLHEFATIPGVREDVADIILNIKALCLKMEGEGEKILRIECSGEQEVTAANIIADSDVEILNPELHIATLDKDAVFNMEIHIDKGRGYVPADKNKQLDQSVLGVIPVDSIYSDYQSKICC